MRVLLIVLAACGGGSGGGGNPDGTPPSPDVPPGECPLQAFWSLNESGGTARVIDANLRFDAPVLTAEPAVVVSQAITGDFTLVVSAGTWMPGGSGASLEAVLTADVSDPNTELVAALVESPSRGVHVDTPELAAPEFRPSTMTVSDVSLTFQRTGSFVSIIATTDDAAAQAESTLADPALRIAIRLRSITGLVNAPTLVEVSNFEFDGTGGSSDSFSCN